MEFKKPSQSFHRALKRLAPQACLAACALVAALGLARAETPSASLTYTKIMKGSSPEFLSVTVNRQGEGVYDGRRIEETPHPRSFKLSAETTQRLFDLAQSLGYFQSLKLESGRKVANLGRKTLVYEDNGQKSQTEFNYTLRREAQDLTNLFERISTVQEHIATLEHAIKFDHLSLPKELLQIQIDLDKQALADPQLMVPTLEQISRGSKFLHLAQVRAQNILQRLQTNN